MSVVAPPRAPCAADPAAGPGRFVPEPSAAPHRSEYQRDRDRILHCTAFRRLALKTQVLLPEEGDHHRTRLTHSLEVAQIARSLARTLGFDEDLTEALALAHDLGHSPFGHTGEDALNRCVVAWGGFDHNAQSLRIVVDLEQRYLDFDGLNLTWDTLEGLAKRHGPVGSPTALLRHYDAMLDLRLDRWPSGEAQIAAAADDIAYNAHDLEDGLRAGLIRLDDARTVPVVADLLQRCHNRGRPDPARLPFALARGLIDLFVTDVIVTTRERLSADGPGSVEQVRTAGRASVVSSATMREASAALKRFLFANLYRHPRLVAVRERAAAAVTRMTERFLAEPGLMPDGWGERATRPDCPDPEVARLVIDYVAGMTDRYALREYRRLFDDVPVLS